MFVLTPLQGMQLSVLTGAHNSKNAFFKVIKYCKIPIFIFFNFKNTSFSGWVFDCCLVGFSGQTVVNIYE